MHAVTLRALLALAAAAAASHGSAAASLRGGAPMLPDDVTARLVAQLTVKQQAPVSVAAAAEAATSLTPHARHAPRAVDAGVSEMKHGSAAAPPAGATASDGAAAAVAAPAAPRVRFAHGRSAGGAAPLLEQHHSVDAETEEAFPADSSSAARRAGSGTRDTADGEGDGDSNDNVVSGDGRFQQHLSAAADASTGKAAAKTLPAWLEKPPYWLPTPPEWGPPPAHIFNSWYQPRTIPQPVFKPSPFSYAPNLYRGPPSSVAPPPQYINAASLYSPAAEWGNTPFAMIEVSMHRANGGWGGGVGGDATASSSVLDGHSGIDDGAAPADGEAEADGITSDYDEYDDEPDEHVDLPAVFLDMRNEVQREHSGDESAAATAGHAGSGEDVESRKRRRRRRRKRPHHEHESLQRSGGDSLSWSQLVPAAGDGVHNGDTAAAAMSAARLRAILAVHAGLVSNDADQRSSAASELATLARTTPNSA